MSCGGATSVYHADGLSPSLEVSLIHEVLIEPIEGSTEVYHGVSPAIDSNLIHEVVLDFIVDGSTSVYHAVSPTAESNLIHEVTVICGLAEIGTTPSPTTTPPPTPAITSSLLLTDEYNSSANDDPAINETTSSITTVDDSLLVVMLTISNHAEAVNGTTTVSGGGLTWTKQVDQGSNYLSTYYITTEIWTAPVTTGASITLDIDSSAAAGSGFGGYLQYTIWSVENYDSVGATATSTFSANGSHSSTLSGAPATTSLVMAVRGITTGDSNNTSATQGSGWTELVDVNHTGTGLLSMQAQERDGSTSTSVSWAEISSHSTVTMGSTAALEITQ